MFDEVWKSIPGYEGLYEVSNLGHVKLNQSSGGFVWRFKEEVAEIGR